MNLISKLIKIEFSLFIIFSVLITTVFAEYITIPSEDIQMDKALSSEVSNLRTPESLVIVPIVAPSRDFSVNDLDWYKGIFYYQTTRYGLPASSFHYIITGDGRLIEDEYSSTDRKIDFNTNLGVDNPIVVGYFAEPGSIKFDPIAKDKITDIILDIVNENGIPLEKIYVKEIEFKEGQNRELVINLDDIFIGWEQDLLSIIESIRPNYAPVERIYKIDLSSYSIPEEPLEIGTEIEAEFKIKNTSKFPIYKGASSEILLTKISDTPSQFYINETWLSQTQVAILSDGEVMKPGEEKSFNIKLKVPFGVGSISENFKILNGNGEELLPGPIEIKLNIQSSDKPIVEITDTGTGYLKVRKGPSLAEDEVTRVSPGEKYFELDRQNGFVLIQLSEEETGWVYTKYTKRL